MGSRLPSEDARLAAARIEVAAAEDPRPQYVGLNNCRHHFEVHFRKIGPLHWQSFLPLHLPGALGALHRPQLCRPCFSSAPGWMALLGLACGNYNLAKLERYRTLVSLIKRKRPL